MEIHVSTPAEKAAFRDIVQAPVVEFIAPEWVTNSWMICRQVEAAKDRLYN